MRVELTSEMFGLPPIAGWRPPLSEKWLASLDLGQRRIELLAEAATLLWSGSNPDTDVMPMLTRALAAHHDIDGSLGYVVTDNRQGMKLGFMEGFDADMVQRCLTLDFGQAICGTVAATGQPIHVGDIQTTLDPLADLVRGAGVNAYACEPLFDGTGKLLGTLSFASREKRSFDPEDLGFFRALAKHVAAARARARTLAHPEPEPHLDD